MARVTFRPDLVKFLLAHEGMAVTIDGIMRAMPNDVKESSVRGAMRKITDEGHFKITVLAAGHSWRVDGVNPASAADRVAAFENELKTMVGPLEILGKMENGSQLARCNASGKVYALRAL